ncbi:MAG: FHA domain-containing protein [Kofleriaceae bacterium]
MRLSIYERYGNAPPRREIASDPAVSIGRDPESGIVLDDPSVAQHHALITADGDSLVIEVLDSQHGTYADGQRLRGTTRVRRQAAIAIGRSILIFDHLPVQFPESFEDAVTRPYANDEWENHITPNDVDTPIEQRFLLHVRDNPSDLDMRMVFADWLEEKGLAAKSEFLRLVLQAGDHPNPVLEVRLRILAEQLPLQWRAIITRAAIEKCDPRFANQCPRTWESLVSTDDPAVRHCEMCHRPVHFCVDLAAVRRRGRSGDCVAFCTSLLRDHALHTYEHDPVDELVLGEIALED